MIEITLRWNSEDGWACGEIVGGKVVSVGCGNAPEDAAMELCLMIAARKGFGQPDVAATGGQLGTRFTASCQVPGAAERVRWNATSGSLLGALMDLSAMLAEAEDEPTGTAVPEERAR